MKVEIVAAQRGQYSPQFVLDAGLTGLADGLVPRGRASAGGRRFAAWLGECANDEPDNSERDKQREGLAPALEAAFREGGVQLVIVPVDYTENSRVLVDELRNRVMEVAK